MNADIEIRLTESAFIRENPWQKMILRGAGVAWRRLNQSLHHLRHLR